MIIFRCYIPSCRIDGAIESLRRADARISPVTYGSNESRTGTGKMVGSTEAFMEFREANPCGFFLFAPSCRYDVTIRNGEECSVIMAEPDSGVFEIPDVLGILSALSSSASFAFACSLDEYHHRNMYSVKMGMNQVEAWVGRDVSKYLPGMYWITAFSEETARRIGGLPFDSVPPVEIHVLGAGLTALVLYPNAADWQDNVECVDRFCLHHAAFFSLPAIMPALKRASSFIELTSILGQWR